MIAFILGYVTIALIVGGVIFGIGQARGDNVKDDAIIVGSLWAIFPPILAGYFLFRLLTWGPIAIGRWWAQPRPKTATVITTDDGPHRNTSTCSNCGAHLETKP